MGAGIREERWRRERMSPQREPREAIPAEREGPERERAEERTYWEQLRRRRGEELGERERRSKREWSKLYGRQERQREQLAKDCRGMLGRFRAWRELGGKLREIGGTIRGRTEVLGRFREELEHRQRWERVSLGKAHSEAVRGIESKAGEVYHCGMEGSEERAREAARMDGFSLRYRHRDVDWYRLKRSASEERMEQVREIDGEQAYEKMMRDMEKADQEKARPRLLPIFPAQPSAAYFLCATSAARLVLPSSGRLYDGLHPGLPGRSSCASSVRWVQTLGPAHRGCARLDEARLSAGETRVDKLVLFLASCPPFSQRIRCPRNRGNSSHRRVKGRLQPMLGFKTFYNARRIIIGIELAQKIHKRQFAIPIPWQSNPAVIWHHVMAA